MTQDTAALPRNDGTASAAIPRLRIEGLAKSFAQPVLKSISLSIMPGEVLALVGANGAGKSTFARILAGLTTPDAGSIWLDGQPFAPRDHRAAVAAGVQLVLQELSQVPQLSVAENLFLGQWPHRFGWLRYRTLAEQTRTALARVGLADLNPWQPMHRLGIGQQQLVEIAKMLDRPCRLLILDEPTAALTGPEIDRLFTEIRHLTRAGGSVIYISHRLDELRQIADRYVVLRDGELAATGSFAGVSNSDLVQAMVGRELASRLTTRVSRTRRAPALEVRGLARPPIVQPTSLTLYRGEILGLAGLIGSGRTELLRLLFGADRATSGEVIRPGRRSTRPWKHPREALSQRIGFVPEDRKRQGLFLARGLDFNATITVPDQITYGPGLVHHRRQRDLATRVLDGFQTRYQRLQQPVRELSGGNQQKVLISRWLLRNCDVLLFDEPTRGVDVAAKSEIYRQLDQLADEGRAVVVVSSEWQELFEICDRLLVLSQGEIVGELTRENFDEATVLRLALTRHLDSQPSGNGVS